MLYRDKITQLFKVSKQGLTFPIPTLNPALILSVSFMISPTFSSAPAYELM